MHSILRFMLWNKANMFCRKPLFCESLVDAVYSLPTFYPMRYAQVLFRDTLMIFHYHFIVCLGDLHSNILLGCLNATSVKTKHGVYRYSELVFNHIKTQRTCIFIGIVCIFFIPFYQELIIEVTCHDDTWHVFGGSKSHHIVGSSKSPYIVKVQSHVVVNLCNIMLYSALLHQQSSAPWNAKCLGMFNDAKLHANSRIDA